MKATSSIPVFFWKTCPATGAGQMPFCSTSSGLPILRAKSVCALMIKGNPSYANRFQKSFVLQPGMNRIRIDCEEFGRTSGGAMMDLSHVMRMGLFYFNAEKDEVFYMDNVRLLKGEQ